MMPFTRLFLFSILLFPALLGATGGPARTVPVPPVLDQQWLKDFLHNLEPVTAEDFVAPMDAAERAEMAAMFANAPVFSDRSDDIRKVAKLTSELKEEVDRARGILDRVRDPLRQVANLVDAQLADLPLGIRRDFGNVEVFLAIGEARLKATYAEVDLYLGLDLPNTEQDPIFVAKGIKWSRQSGFIGDVEMQLIADWGIDMQAGKSRLILHKTGRDGTGGSAAVVTCEGLQSANLEMSLLLSRDWVVPVINGIVLSDPAQNDDVDPYSTARVSAHFDAAFNREDGFYFDTQFGSPFAFTGKEDVHIDVEQVVVDFSSVKNAAAPAMEFPEGYRSNFVEMSEQGETVNVDPRWQGVYISGVTVTIPEEFRENSTTDLVVGAPQVIIDDTGISAHLYATGIMDLGKKTVDEWAFSVDSLDLKILHSTFQQAKITGLINIPMLGAKANCDQEVTGDMPIIEEDCLSYRAIIRTNNSYYFSVGLNRDYCLPVFKAGEVIIEENTMIELAYVERELSATATLYGTINIQMGDPGTDAEFSVRDLSFDALVLRTRKPYFEPGVWDFPSEITARFKGFELGFERINLEPGDDPDGGECALTFLAYVSFDGELDLDAAGSFRMRGALANQTGGQRWRFRNLKLDAFSIYASTSSFEVGAALAFYGQGADEEDAVWGSGFYGYGSLMLKSLPAGSAGFSAVAQFGKKDGTKYFMIDVMGVFAEAAIPVFPGLNLGALGGGVYKNMSASQAFISMKTDSGDTFDDYARIIENDRAADEPTSALTGIVGKSLSGKQYRIVDDNLGIYVQLVLLSPNEASYSITGKLEVEINGTNGWQAGIQASAQAMSPPNYSGDLKLEKGVGIFVDIAVKKLGEEVSFEASAEVFINVANNKISGINSDQLPSDPDRARFVSPNGFAGGAYLKFSTSEWYLHVGRPNAKLGIKVPVAEAGAYFCLGNNIPPIPNLPDNVTEIAGDLNLTRDMSVLENGSGFAFGASIDLEGDGSFLIFNYDYAAGVGFDLNIRNYGEAVCESNRNGPAIGVNGWYAAGQAWAYLTGEVRTVGIPIFKASLAAVLQLKGPSPTWARVSLSGDYRLPLFFKKKTFNIEVEFGNNCRIVGRNQTSIFAGVDILTNGSVADGADDVDPGILLKTSTSMPMEKRFDMNDEDYRVKLIENTLTLAATGELVKERNYATAGSFNFSNPTDFFLEPETEYIYTVEVKVEKYVSGGTEEEKTERRVVRFTTGKLPDVILPSNLKSAYPFNGMVNMYREEYEQGKIILYRAQTNVTDSLTAVWEDNRGLKTTSKVTVSGKTLLFDIPKPWLRGRQQYKLALVQNYRLPVSSGGGGSEPDENNELPGGGLQSGAGGLNYMVPVPDLTIFMVQPPERTVFECYFRVSRHQTFRLKVAAMTEGVTDRPGDQLPQNFITAVEGWSVEELQPSFASSLPIVSVKMSSSNTFPDRYITDEVLPRSGSIRLHDPYGYGNFSNFVLSNQQENGVYFEADSGADTAYPPPVGPGTFDADDYSALVSGQAFILAYPKRVSKMLTTFGIKLSTIPTKVLNDLGSISEGGLTPSGSGGTELISTNGNEINYDILESLPCIDNPEIFMGREDGGIPDWLRTRLARSWKTEAELSDCPIHHCVRMALREIEKFGIDRFNYRSQDFLVDFKYQPPGMPSRTITRTVQIP